MRRGRAAAPIPDTPTGLDCLLGGRAKSGIVRALADRPSARLTDLIRAVGMSKSAVTNALTQLVQSGAVRTYRVGREVLVEATDCDVIVELASFDRRVHRETLTMPVPQEDMGDDALLAMEAYFSEPVRAAARSSRYDEAEAGLPVTEDVWKQPQGGGIKLPGSGFRRFPREEVERMRREVLGSYAPATVLPEHATKVKGTLVSGDLL